MRVAVCVPPWRRAIRFLQRPRLQEMDRQRQGRCPEFRKPHHFGDTHDESVHRHPGRRRPQLSRLPRPAGFRQRPRHRAVPGNLRHQRLRARGGRPLCRGRLRGARTRSLLAHGAQRRPGLFAGRVATRLRLLPEVRHRCRHRRRHREREGAARAPSLHRQGGRAGLLPRRQVGVSGGRAFGRGCGGGLLRRGHRGGARPRAEDRMPDRAALRRARQVLPARGPRPGA